MYPYHFNTPHPHPMSFPSLLSHFVCGLCTPITLSSPTLTLFLGVSLLLTFYSITLCMCVVYPHHFIITYPHPISGCQPAPNLLSYHTLYVCCVPPSLYHPIPSPYFYPVTCCPFQIYIPLVGMLTCTSDHHLSSLRSKPSCSEFLTYLLITLGLVPLDGPANVWRCFTIANLTDFHHVVIRLVYIGISYCWRWN